MDNKHGKKFGWQADRPDHRDFVYGAPAAKLKALPAKVDLRTEMTKMPPYDQGHIGSCTANAIAGAIQFDRQKSGETPDFVPSRLFIYFNERSMEHTVQFDAGAQIRDGIKTVAKQGVCPETEWPYDDTPADDVTHRFPNDAKPSQKPAAACYNHAKDYQALSYLRVTQGLGQMKGCLAEGFPFVLGIRVFPSFFNANNVPETTLLMPSAADLNTEPEGHAILCVGYDDAKGVFICRNSWGSDVQDKGYFYIPYAYATNPAYASDMWTIRQIEA